jgi:hypothetical protein
VFSYNNFHGASGVCGGVSVGESDPVEGVLTEIGRGESLVGRAIRPVVLVLGSASGILGFLFHNIVRSLWFLTIVSSRHFVNFIKFNIDLVTMTISLYGLHIDRRASLLLEISTCKVELKINELSSIKDHFGKVIHELTETLGTTWWTQKSEVIQGRRSDDSAWNLRSADGVELHF